MISMTVSQAREIHAKGYAVIMDGGTHSFFIVEDEWEEDADAQGKRVP